MPPTPAQRKRSHADKNVADLMPYSTNKHFTIHKLQGLRDQPIWWEPFVKPHTHTYSRPTDPLDTVINATTDHENPDFVPRD